jgi:hypothetical protein
VDLGVEPQAQVRVRLRLVDAVAEAALRVGIVAEPDLFVLALGVSVRVVERWQPEF